MTRPAVRAATQDDLPVLVELKDEATAEWGEERATPGSERWDGQLAQLRHLLATGRVLCAERDGEIAGFGSAVRREDVWFLSQLFVRPTRQAARAGASLLDALLETDEARDARVRAVVSSSDPRALGLYFSRGMLPRWVLVQMKRAQPRGGGRRRRLEVLTDDDQASIDAIDRSVRGFTRPEDHAFFRSVLPGYALRRRGKLRAFLYVDPAGRVGPLAAADDAALVAAVAAADALAGPEATWAVPSVAPLLLRELLGRGYRPAFVTTFCADGLLGPFDRTATSGGLLL